MYVEIRELRPSRFLFVKSSQFLPVPSRFFCSFAATRGFPSERCRAVIPILRSADVPTGVVIFLNIPCHNQLQLVQIQIKTLELKLKL